MHPVLLTNIQKYISLSEEERQLFGSHFVSKMVKKRHYLLQEGEINKGLTFVTNGILRNYTIDENGFEHVIQFAPTGWWMVDMNSFTQQKPARLFIDALENTEILWLPKNNLNQLFERITKLERLFRILAENAVASYQNRLIGHLSQPAKQRYNSFCAQYPTLIKCLPQKQIASYIGVTPEFLSKMLKNNPTD